jgi:hypothetical protein
LNFTNVLFVSSASQPDKIKIELKMNKFFVARKDEKKMELLTKSSDMPRLFASKEDAKNIKSLATGAQNSMLITLIIPFCFMIFMSVSMNRVWSLYLMMQIIGNIADLRNFVIPSNA